MSEPTDYRIAISAVDNTVLSVTEANEVRWDKERFPELGAAIVEAFKVVLDNKLAASPAVPAPSDGMEKCEPHGIPKRFCSGCMGAVPAPTPDVSYDFLVRENGELAALAILAANELGPTTKHDTLRERIYAVAMRQPPALPASAPTPDALLRSVIVELANLANFYAEHKEPEKVRRVDRLRQRVATVADDAAQRVSGIAGASPAPTREMVEALPIYNFTQNAYLRRDTVLALFRAAGYRDGAVTEGGSLMVTLPRSLALKCLTHLRDIHEVADGWNTQEEQNALTNALSSVGAITTAARVSGDGAAGETA